MFPVISSVLLHSPFKGIRNFLQAPERFKKVCVSLLPFTGSSRLRSVWPVSGSHVYLTLGDHSTVQMRIMSIWTITTLKPGTIL